MQRNDKTERRPLVTAERARELLDYNPETGVLRWRTKRRGQKRNIATCLSSSGYSLIGLDYRLYRAHRVMWLLMTGKWPDHDIDHINGVRTDNRWVNLRSATRTQNTYNRCAQRNNKSGYKGVFFHKRANRWQAVIGVDGKRIHLGCFRSPELAAAAYARAAKIHHGDFARAA